MLRSKKAGAAQLWKEFNPGSRSIQAQISRNKDVAAIRQKNDTDSTDYHGLRSVESVAFLKLFPLVPRDGNAYKDRLAII
jgi:hypothetical protein